MFNKNTTLLKNKYQNERKKSFSIETNNVLEMTETLCTLDNFFIN